MYVTQVLETVVAEDVAPRFFFLSIIDAALDFPFIFYTLLFGFWSTDRWNCWYVGHGTREAGMLNETLSASHICLFEWFIWFFLFSNFFLRFYGDDCLARVRRLLDFKSLSLRLSEYSRKRQISISKGHISPVVILMISPSKFMVDFFTNLRATVNSPP